MKHLVHILTTILIVGSAFGDKLPNELERLNEQRARQISEIDKIYRNQLEILKLKFTKSGDLEAANQVVAILETMLPAGGSEAETSWEWGSGGELVLRPNGVATHTVWKKNGNCRREEDGSIRLESDTGIAFTIRIDGDVGHVLDLQVGKRTTIKRRD